MRWLACAIILVRVAVSANELHLTAPNPTHEPASHVPAPSTTHNPCVSDSAKMDTHPPLAPMSNLCVAMCTSDQECLSRPVCVHYEKNCKNHNANGFWCTLTSVVSGEQGVTKTTPLCLAPSCAVAGTKHSGWSVVEGDQSVDADGVSTTFSCSAVGPPLWLLVTAGIVGLVCLPACGIVGAVYLWRMMRMHGQFEHKYAEIG
jgi:hypothetical protein